MSRAWEVAAYFFKLGLTGFGGPLALISLMQKDLIEDRRWIPMEEFAQALSLIKAMPGALAFQMAVYLGRRRAGFLGGTLAGLALLLPSSLLMIVLAIYYDLAEKFLGLRSFFNGMQAAAIVLMIQGLRALVWPYFKEAKFWIFFIAGGTLFIAETLPEPLLILGAGACGLLWRQKTRLMVVAANFEPTLAISSSGAVWDRWGDLAWVCFKSGAVVFGSGLAIVPMLERDFVDRLHWLTYQQFLDALALGQITPGPVLVTVTFIGFRAAGFFGAVMATVMVFLPGYFHMQTWFPGMVGYISRQKWVNDFLIPCLGVICGVLLLTIFRLTLAWHGNMVLLMIVLVGAIFSVMIKIPSWALIGLGGLIGMALGG